MTAEITREARAAAESLIEKDERRQENEPDACFADDLGPIKPKAARRESRRQTTKDPA